MKELEGLFNKRGIKFDNKDNRIGCYPHIINICVSHIISSLTKVDRADSDGGSDDDSEDDSEDEDDVGHGTGFDAAEYDGEWFTKIKRDPVKRARKVIRAVRASGQRREALSAIIKSGNQTGLFQDEYGDRMQVKDVQLIKDVRHRWDSLYLMLSRLELLQQVISTYLYFYY